MQIRRIGKYKLSCLTKWFCERLTQT
jgi:hypothetical protein